MASARKRLSSGWIRGGLALLAGGGIVGVGLLLKRRLSAPTPEVRDRSRDRWARPGMGVTFRAELMPGRDTEQRTFRVAELLPSGRVLLEDIGGEHDENEFESQR